MVNTDERKKEGVRAEGKGEKTNFQAEMPNHERVNQRRFAKSGGSKRGSNTRRNPDESTDGTNRAEKFYPVEPG